MVPPSAFFGGLGGGWTSGSFGHQDVYGKGTSYSPPYGINTAQIGSAAGSTGLELDSQSALAPLIQAGYFQHFSGSQWMGGGKFSYSYLGIGSAKSLQQIPQAGGFTQNGTYTAFTGNYLVQSYRQTINQQLSLIPFIGRSFERSYVYLGLGPTTAQTKTSIDNITGFEDVAVITTTPTGIGLGQKYSTTQWLFGGVAMLGATYFIDPTWFMDISYTYSITGTKTSRWGGPWTDTDIARASVTRTGTNTGTSAGSVNIQALMLTINKVF
jgi:opacity protein-like surface antigen